jgi:polysaccharide biosynthesis/export protein
VWVVRPMVGDVLKFAYSASGPHSGGNQKRMIQKAKTRLFGILLAAILGCVQVGFGQDKENQGSQQKPSAERKDADSKGSSSASGQTVTPSDFIIGESDVLNINVWKEPEISQSVVVRPDGKISLPLVGEVLISGLTPVQAQTLLANKLQSILTNPQVTVTVTEIRSRVVSITGEVGKPGSYPLLAPTTVLQLITNAGGLGQFANKKGIFVLRTVNGKQQRLPFNYKLVIKGENPGQNILLRPGDTVVVP